jgi:hypothetical protein
VKEETQYEVNIIHSVFVALPTTSALTGITTPWRVRIYIGTITITFEAQGDAGCDPTQLDFKLNKSESYLPTGTSYNSPCVGLNQTNCYNIPGSSVGCNFVNPPPIWPCTGSYAGDLIRHEVIVDIGAIRLT